MCFIANQILQRRKQAQGFPVICPKLRLILGRENSIPLLLTEPDVMSAAVILCDFPPK